MTDRTETEALRSALAEKDASLAETAHELRTPLTAIRALAELLQDTPDMDPARRAEFVGIILAEVARLNRLVDRLLDEARAAAEPAGVRQVPVDLRALVLDAARTTAALFHARGATIATLVPERVTPVDADPDALKQVLLNLLSNAANALPPAGGCVEIRLTPEPGALRVEVADNGPGVPEGDRDRIFARFDRGSDPASRPPGTGLGLPISRQIVEHCGGELWLESTKGSGACFAFRLPVRPESRSPGGGQPDDQGADRR